MENKYLLKPPKCSFPDTQTARYYEAPAVPALFTRYRSLHCIALPIDSQKAYFDKLPPKMYADLETGLSEYRRQHDDDVYDFKHLRSLIAVEMEEIKYRPAIAPHRQRQTRPIKNQIRSLLAETRKTLYQAKTYDTPLARPAIFTAKPVYKQAASSYVYSPYTPLFYPEVFLKFSPFYAKQQQPESDVIFVDERAVELEKLRIEKAIIKPQTSVVDNLAARLAEKYHVETDTAPEEPHSVENTALMGQLAPAVILKTSQSPRSQQECIEIVKQIRLSNGQTIDVNSAQFALAGWLDDHGILYGLEQLIDTTQCFVLDPLAFSNYQVMERCVQDARKHHYTHYIAPLCYDEHWIGLVYNVYLATLYIFDSLNVGPAPNKKHAFVHFVGQVLDRYMTESGANLTKGNYQLERLRMNYQQNAYDCGIFCILGIEALVQGRQFGITQADATKLRQELHQALLE